MTPNFEQALAEHGSAEEAIRHTLQNVYEDAIGDIYASFGPVAQWVFANAPAIHQHQSGLDRSNDSMINALGREVDELAERVQALEDAPGPRPNAAEVSALRQRMDALTETLEKMRSLDTSDVLTALVRDVALLKDDRIIRSHPAAKMDHISALMKMFGTEPQTPEARKLLGLDVATPEAEPVYEWIGNDYYYNGKAVGGISQIYNDQWIAICSRRMGTARYEHTEAEARAWVEAQFSNPKNQ